MKRIEYYAPDTLKGCLEALNTVAGARPLAGGTDLIPRMKEANGGPSAVVSLRNVEELREVSLNEDLSIGAMTRLAPIATQIETPVSCEALREAAGLIGSWQIRNAATLGGNLCNAAPSADTVPALLCLDANALVAHADGERMVPLSGFFRGPGKTVLGPGEVLRSVVLPRPPKNSGSTYLRHTPRSRMDLAVAGVGVAVTLEDDVVVQARIGLGAVAPTPVRAWQAEAKLVGRRPGEGWLDDVAATAATESAPIDDLRGSVEYRRHLVSVLVRRAVDIAYARALAEREEGS